ncbi:MAG: hypothetical protein QNJ15_05405 [Erythrobacter sp.]|nr:hypothetical protein [Erythrobacter sp.]
MSDNSQISPNSPLGRLLAADKAPNLPDDFADRVLARTGDRPAPLPESRTGGGGVRRWRSVRRLAIGGIVAGALATTAAATGLLGDLPISVPSVEKVWATITGREEPSEPAAPVQSQGSADLVPDEQEPVRLEGPIDSPKELEEAFRRVDEVRAKRTGTRRERVDRRIDNVIDRRREQGLRVPTPGQEERLRERIDRFRERRDERIDERLDTRRDELRERVESGEELTREDFIREQRDAVGRPVRGDRLERFREMSPEERRERLRRLRERRQERRQERLEQQASPDRSVDEALATEESGPPPTPEEEIDQES